MHKPLVTIILPVYNVAEYLHQSLDSIIDQTYRNIEIICVDDGSTDNSYNILKEYETADSRVNIIRQNNQGVSKARNKGIKKATGKYIIFLDPDDYFALNAIEMLVEKAEKEQADVCLCDMQDFFFDTGKFIAHNYIVPPYPKASTFSWRDCPNHIFMIGSSSQSNKLVLLSLIKENNIEFFETPYLEDNSYMFLVMCYAKKITICKKKLIYYRLNRPNSLVQTIDSTNMNVVSVFRQFYDELNSRHLLEDPYLRNGFFAKTASMYHYRIRYYSSFEHYSFLYDKFLSSESPLTDYDPHYGKISIVEEMKKYSAGDYLLNKFKIVQTANSDKLQKLNDNNEELQALTNSNAELTDTSKELQHLNEILEQKNKELKAENRKLKADIKQIRSSRSFKIGKAITYIPRKLK